MSINRIILTGVIGKEPEVTFNNNNSTQITRFSLAVRRNFKDSNGEYGTDWLNCVAFGKTGEFISKYFFKGSSIAIEGRIQTGKYTAKDGHIVYTTDVIVDNAEFMGSKEKKEETAPAMPEGEFMNIPDSLDESLPFA